MPFNPRSTEMNRREFVRCAGLGGAALLAGGAGSRLFASEIDPATLALMEFDVSYRTQVKQLPRDAEKLDIWMPIPSSDAGQEISGLAIESPLPVEMTTEPTFDSKILHVSANAPMKPFGVEARYRVTRRRTGIQKAVLPEAERGKYLKLTRRVRVTDEVEAFAREIIGEATDPYEVGRRVFDGIRGSLFYDQSLPGCGTGDTAWIMKYRRGKCDDYHALFMAIMISRGIPIRWEQGFPLPFPEAGKVETGQLEGDCSGSHCWASFYAPSHGWVPVDISEGDKTSVNPEFFFGNLSPNRFQVSVGRAVVLSPPQGGDPLSTFAFAYAEADGIPLIYPANYENIIRYDVTRVEMG